MHWVEISVLPQEVLHYKTSWDAKAPTPTPVTAQHHIDVATDRFWKMNSVLIKIWSQADWSPGKAPYRLGLQLVMKFHELPALPHLLTSPIHCSLCLLWTSWTVCPSIVRNSSWLTFWEETVIWVCQQLLWLGDPVRSNEQKVPVVSNCVTHSDSWLQHSPTEMSRKMSGKTMACFSCVFGSLRPQSLKMAGMSHQGVWPVSQGWRLCCLWNEQTYFQSSLLWNENLMRTC